MDYLYNQLDHGQTLLLISTNPYLHVEKKVRILLFWNSLIIGLFTTYSIINIKTRLESLQDNRK